MKVQKVQIEADSSIRQKGLWSYLRKQLHPLPSPYDRKRLLLAEKTITPDGGGERTTLTDVYGLYTLSPAGVVLMLYIESLEIDDHILDKIESKHGVAFEEVEETCLSERRHVRRGREGLYKLFGRTEAGRYILVVLVHLGGGDWKIVTAREMTEGERRLYTREIGGR